MCNKCCKYKSSLNENGVCKECEENDECPFWEDEDDEINANEREC